MIIRKEEMEQILKEMAKEGTFLSEAQFQFDLAWKLKEHFGDRKIHIYLEYPDIDSRADTDGKYKKNRYDILLEDNERKKKCIIELKYKTKKETITYGGNQFELKNQSAQDFGRYDYLYDVSRIEAYRDNGSDDFDNGFAILLTNDDLYWKLDGKGSNYVNFSLCEKVENDYNVTIEAGKKEWENNPNVGKLRKNGFTLAERYEGRWVEYAGTFKYLLLEIKAKGEQA